MHIDAVLDELLAYHRQHDLHKELGSEDWNSLETILRRLQHAGEDVEAKMLAFEDLAAFCGQNDVLRPLLAPGVAGQPRWDPRHETEPGFAETGERVKHIDQQREAKINELVLSEDLSKASTKKFSKRTQA